MKQKRIINLLFSGIVVVLLSLAAIALVNQNKSQRSTDLNTTPTFDIALSVTQTLDAMVSATQAAKPTETPIQPTVTSQPSTATPYVLPEEAYIRGFVGHRQAYSIGCETSVAVDLAAFYDVTITEYDFQTNLPLSDNPDLGFVGDVNGPWGQIPPYAYGVHAAPVADLLTKFGVPAVGGKGYTLDQIKEQLAQSKPVIVWVIGHMEYSEPVSYTDKQGTTTLVAPYEHVVVLTGYNADKVRYNNEGRYAEVNTETFLNSWGVLGNMAVFHE